ncbi:MAG: hypothetical protein QOC96_1441 [Acidobacteriota bacterium]|jgi:hypothetical protein|nr:hypothetical protein [Acidobacteriota bacterium]
MITKEPPAEIEHGLTLAERRAYMKLPLVERRRQLAVQAEMMAKYYESQTETMERERWQGGDIVES